VNWLGREGKVLAGRTVYSKPVCESMCVSIPRELHRKCICDFGSSLTICTATAMAGYKCPPVPPPAKKKHLSYDCLETIAEPHVHIRIVLELAEEGLRVVTEEDIAADLDRHVVVYLIINVRTHVNVFIRRAVVSKQ
jgi:hypothetical protein